MKSSCPASLDTLKVSVPPAVKVAAATANLDIFWLKDEPLEDSKKSDVRGQTSGLRRIEDLQAALVQFAEIAADLKSE